MSLISAILNLALAVRGCAPDRASDRPH